MSYILCLFTLLLSLKSYAFELIWESSNESHIKVLYHEGTDEYEIKNKSASAIYKRSNFKDFIDYEAKFVEKESQNEFKNSIVVHALKFGDIKFIERKSHAEGADVRQATLIAASKGYVPIGDIISVKTHIDNENDNPYNGLFGFIGLSNYGEGLEGDDRGDTFSINGEVEVTFEEGILTLRKNSKMYGKFSDENENAVSSATISNAKGFKAIGHRNADGEVLLDALTIDNIEIEFKKFLGDERYFVKVLTRYKKMQDQAGLALKTQELYHKQIKKYFWDNMIIYDYQNHMDDRKGLELEGELGGVLNLYHAGDYKVDATLSSSMNLSSIASSESYGAATARLEYQYAKNPRTRMSGFRAHIYHTHKFYFDGEKGSRSGLGLSYGKDFKYCTLYTNYEIQYNDDRFENIYGVEELQRSNRLDTNHLFGVGADCKL